MKRENRIVVDKEACEWIGQTSSAMPMGRLSAMDTVGGVWGDSLASALLDFYNIN